MEVEGNKTGCHGRQTLVKTGVRLMILVSGSLMRQYLELLGQLAMSGSVVGKGWYLLNKCRMQTGTL